jgi:hypothetical protein
MTWILPPFWERVYSKGTSAGRMFLRPICSKGGTPAVQPCGDLQAKDSHDQGRDQNDNPRGNDCEQYLRHLQCIVRFDPSTARPFDQGGNRAGRARWRQRGPKPTGPIGLGFSARFAILPGNPYFWAMSKAFDFCIPTWGAAGSRDGASEWLGSKSAMDFALPVLF